MGPEEVLEFNFAMMEDTSKTPREFDALDLADMFDFTTSWFCEAMKNMSLALELGATFDSDTPDFVAAKVILFYCQQKRISQDRFERAVKILVKHYTGSRYTGERTLGNKSRLNTFSKLQLYLLPEEKKKKAESQAKETVHAPHEQIKQID